MTDRPVIHLTRSPWGITSYCGRRFYKQRVGEGLAVTVRGRREGRQNERTLGPVLLSWSQWLSVVHPAPFTLCAECRRAHAPELPEML